MTSLQCVEAFSLAQPEEEQNREGYWPQSGQYLHSWGEVVTDGIRAGPVIVGSETLPHKVGPNEDVRDLSGEDCDTLIWLIVWCVWVCDESHIR